MIDGLVVLHMSDLHFGNKYRFGIDNAEAMGKKFGDSIRINLDRKNLRVGLIIVSGDFVETGKPEEFKSAQCFLNAMCGELGLPPKTIIGVPGNHDIARPDCRTVRNQYEMGDFDASLLEQKITEAKLKRYDNFMRENDITETDTVLGSLTKIPVYDRCFIYDFYESKIAIATLNSVDKEDDITHGGAVSKEQITAFMQAFSDVKFNGYFKIAIVHHNPTVTTDKNLDYNKKYLETVDQLNKGEIDQYIGEWTGFEGRDMFQRLIQNRHFHLVLHGHQHDSQDQMWRWEDHEDGVGYIFSAGSLGLIDSKLPDTVPLSCNLFFVKFRKEDNKLHRISFQYDGDFSTINDVVNGNLVNISDKDIIRKVHVGTGFFNNSGLACDHHGLPRMIILHDYSDGTEKVITEMKYYTKPLSGKILAEYWDIDTLDSKISNDKYLDGVKWVIILMNRMFFSAAEGNPYCKDIISNSKEKDIPVMVLELYESLFDKMGLNGIPYSEMNVYKGEKPFEGMVESEKSDFFNGIFYKIMDSIE